MSQSGRLWEILTAFLKNRQKSDLLRGHYIDETVKQTKGDLTV
jgi:hypothetical protein